MVLEMVLITKNMKQRPLTSIQLTVLTMKMAGENKYAISQFLGIHPDTVSLKYRAILRGIQKGAYNNLPKLNATGDLFECCTAEEFALDRTTGGWIGQPWVFIWHVQSVGEYLRTAHIAISVKR